MEMEREPFNLIFYLRVFKKWKGWILVPASLVASMVLTTGLRSPRPYTAETTILLSGPGGLSVGASGLFGIPQLAVGNPNISIIDAMIHSKRMAEDVIDHFKLARGKDTRGKALMIRKVRGMIGTSETKTGLVIQATSNDPQLSSDIANFCVSNLDVMNLELNITTEKPIAKVLDPATPPLFPSSRKIIPRVFLAFFVSAAGSTTFVFLREYMKELHRRENTEEQMLSVEIPEKEKEEVLL